MIGSDQACPKEEVREERRVREMRKEEAGSQAVSVPMSRLLTLLANDPKRLRELPGAPKAAKRASKGA